MIKILKSFKCFSSTSSIVEKDLVNYIRNRQCLSQISSENFKIQPNDKVYIGFDPTADKLHIGNLVGIINAMRCAAFGLQPIFLIGGATGLIGDPKNDIERPQLSVEVIENNSNHITKIIERTVFCIKNSEHYQKLLKVNGILPNNINHKIINNKDIYKDLNIIDFLREIGSNLRMGPMLSREIIKNRLNTTDGLSLTEFMYQSFQAYDFYYLFKNHQVRFQLGGSDQWGNMLSGLELINKKYNKNEKQEKSTNVTIITHPLLTTSCGKKLGKSEGNSISICDENPQHMYQYLLNLSDDDIEPLLYKLTFLTKEEIDQVCEEQRKTPEKRIGHKTLANFVLENYCNKDKISQCVFQTHNFHTTQLSISYFENTRKTSLLREEVINIKFSDFLQNQNLTESKTQLRRLLELKSVKINNNLIIKDKIIDNNDLFEGKYLMVQLGKTKKHAFEISN